MSEEILINVAPMETRVAIVENGVVQEIYVERVARRGLVGGIYKGRVVRVLPGMQAAFVDIGLEKSAFIHVNDIALNSARETGADGAVINAPSIDEVVSEGQPIIVQIAKDMIGSKGARLTTQLSVPSRYLVLMPGTAHVGVSQRIEDESERERLRTAVEDGKAPHDLPEDMGFIVRTAAEGVDSDAIKADVGFLVKLWSRVQAKSARTNMGQVIHQDLPLAMRTIRDFVRPEVEKVRVDSQDTYDDMMEFVGEFVPEAAARLECYRGERPIFDLYGVETEIERALDRKVQLKSGGYLIIDQTEAMSTIDINTGAFVGHRNLEETIYKTNLEAAQSIARQLRLRNLGGIIIIDFIDMEEDEHKRQVIRHLEKYLERDHAKTNITQVSELGLVEMTRKRTRESLARMLCEPCPACDGRGEVKTPETVCYQVFREIIREARSYECESLLVVASQAVVDRLLDEESAHVADLETSIDRPIKFQVETHYTQEQFDVVLM